MNYLWDIILSARKSGYQDTDLFFKQAEEYSPWYEQAFDCLNEVHVKPVVEFNALYRFSKIFQELLHADLIDFPECQTQLYNAVVHLLSIVDMYHGLSKRDFYLRQIHEDILSGIFGLPIQAQYFAQTKNHQFRLASLVLTQFEAGTSLFLFGKAILVLFPNALLYQKKSEPNQILLYVGCQKTDVLVSGLAFIQDMFFPIHCHLRVFWENHFGVIGVDAVMKLEQIEIY